MTVKEFYEYMVKNSAEEYEMGNWYYDGYGRLDPTDWDINHDKKQVTTDFEC